jgi:hypothetical protein
MNDLAGRVAELVAVVEQARGLPMSASCVLNRVELLTALEDVKALAECALADAAEVVATRDAVVDEARHTAARLVADAEGQCRRLTADSAMVREAEAEATSIVAEAHAASASVRAEIDAYVDTQLAGFEALLSRTLTSVSRGRARLVVPAVDGVRDGSGTPGSVRVLKWGATAATEDAPAADRGAATDGSATAPAAADVCSLRIG